MVKSGLLNLNIEHRRTSIQDDECSESEIYLNNLQNRYKNSQDRIERNGN